MGLDSQLLLSIFLQFLWLKSKTSDPFTNICFSLIYAFSSFFATHIIHLNLIQAASLIPLIFYLYQKNFHKPSFNLTVLLSLLISQQFLAGFPQIVLINIIGLFLWTLTQKLPSKYLLHLKHLVLFCLITFGLSAIQLIPMYHYTKLTSRQTGSDINYIFQFPLTIKHLKTFFLPNSLGTTKDASYYQNLTINLDQFGLYWENLAYVGIIPLLIIIFTALSNKKFSKPDAFLIISTILLALGNQTPLGYIYHLPLINFFRIPSRFLILTIFFIITLSAQNFDQIFTKKSLQKISPLILFLSVFQIVHFSKQLNPVVAYQDFLTPPETLNQIPDQDSFIFTHSSNLSSWSQYYLQHGWSNIQDYLYFNNNLGPNYSLVHNAHNLHYYNSFRTLRQELFYNLPQLSDLLTNQATHVTSTQHLDQPNLKLILETQPPQTQLPPHFLYTNTRPTPQYYFTPYYTPTKNLDSARQLLTSNQDNLLSNPIIETSQQLDLQPPTTQDLKLISQTKTTQTFTTTTDQQTWLILTQAYHPDWQATIDNQPVKIFPANINQKAILIPNGNHTVSLKFTSPSFHQGLLITSITILFILLEFKTKLIQTKILSTKPSV